MWYQLEVDALITGIMFTGAGAVILLMFAWQEAKELAAARHRIYNRLATFTTQPRFFANPLAISRTVSRSGEQRQSI
jgi:hypothetical protein